METSLRAFCAPGLREHGAWSMEHGAWSMIGTLCVCVVGAASVIRDVARPKKAAVLSLFTYSHIHTFTHTRAPPPAALTGEQNDVVL